MANELDRACFPFCNDHRNVDEDFVELDYCEFIGFDGDEAVHVCEVDFD
jgi:hypothetical protein